MSVGEIHVQLAVNFARNKKVRALTRFGVGGILARDLFVQMLCYSKDMLTDGFIPAEEIGVLVYPLDTEIADQSVSHLITTDLINVTEGGFRVTGWLERNDTRDVVRDVTAAKSAGALLANHNRWHRGKGRSDPKCSHCRGTDSDTDQTTDSDRVGEVKRSDSTYTETESETETSKRTSRRPAGSSARSKLGTDADPDFCAFYAAYPRKIGKGGARTPWRKAVFDRHVEPKDIIRAAEQYAALWTGKSRAEREFIPYPGSWLTAERYADDLAPAADGDEYPEDVWSR